MSAMTWVWANGPDRRGNITIAVKVAGIPGYSYFHRNDNMPWRLVAKVDNEADSMAWYAHRVDLAVDADNDTVAFLDVVATAVGGV